MRKFCLAKCKKGSRFVLSTDFQLRLDLQFLMDQISWSRKDLNLCIITNLFHNRSEWLNQTHNKISLQAIINRLNKYVKIQN